MIKTRLFTCIASGLVALTAQSVVAQDGCPASWVLGYEFGADVNGEWNIDPVRLNPEQALGAPQDDDTENFFSLGYGGWVSLAFDGAITDLPGKDIEIYETSYASDDCASDGIEEVTIELTNDTDFSTGVTNWYGAGANGIVCRDGSVDIADFGLEFVTGIRITNNGTSTTFDGYDVDGVLAINGCTSVPNPGCYAESVYLFEQGTKANGDLITDPIRIDENRATGPAENDRSNGAVNFFSLGNGGWIILKMEDAIATDKGPEADIRVYETTWGNPSCANYPEWATISVSADGTHFYPVATVCQSGNISLDIDAALPGSGDSQVQASYVKIETAGPGITEDFFDVDGVEALFGCEPVTEQPQPQDCYAECGASNYMEGTKKNGGALPDARDNAEEADYAEDNDTTTSPANNNFVSLGYGGSIVMCFGGAVENAPGETDFEIIETSFGDPSCDTYPEFADVWVSVDNVDWYYAGFGCHNFEVDIDSIVDAEGNAYYLPYIYYVKIANKGTEYDENNVATTYTTTPDGFDVDGVKILSGPCFGTSDQTQTGGSTEDEARYAVKAYPNPSNGIVNFTFALPESGNATLELFNVNGQRVGSVFNSETNADIANTVTFDMSSLPNGIYISKLTTEDGVTTGKVMLSK
jgi:hypothetical protein